MDFDNADALPRVLIVSSVPFNKSLQSRYLDSCFHNYPSDKLFHVFSDARVPCAGHCDVLYQIRDIDLLKAHFNRKHKVGRFYYKQDLKTEWTSGESENPYSPKRRGTLSYIFRKFLWGQKYWKTKELDVYLTQFKPEAIFVGFSYDFLFFRIAEYYSIKFGIPIIFYVADDFAEAYSKPGLISAIYKSSFNKYMKYLFAKNAYGVFNSENIKERFEQFYGLDGEVVYIPSEIKPNGVKQISKFSDFYYFGSLSLGRYESIVTFAKAVYKRNQQTQIHVFSQSPIDDKAGRSSPNLHFMPAIKYSEVKEYLRQGVNLLYVEGFSRANIKATKYSMSTKIGDYVCSGNPVYVFGPKESGSVSFFLKNMVGNIACSPEELDKMLDNKENSVPETDISCAKSFFDLDEQSGKFREYLTKIVKGGFVK